MTADLRSDTIARNTAFALAAKLSGAAFTAGLTIYLVRALGPHDYGLLALAVATAALVLLPSDLGVSTSAARFIAEHRGSRREVVARLLADALTVKLLVAGLVSAVLFGLAGPVAAAYDEPGLAWPLRAVALAVFGQSILMLLGSAFVALGQTALEFRIDLAESVLETGTAVALVALGGGATGAAFGRTAGYLAAAMIGIFLAVRLLGRQAASIGRPRSGRLRELVRYAGVLFVIDSAFTAFSVLNPMVIGAFLGITAVGLYQAPARLVTFLQYPGYALANGVAPRLARSEREAPAVEVFRASVRYLLVLYVAISVPVLVWADPIAGLVLGEGYGESADVLRALAPFVLLSGLAPLASLSANYLGEARRRVPIALAALAVNLGLTLVLVPQVGIVGAAVSTDVAYALYVLAHLQVCRRMIELPLRPLAVTAGRSLAAGAAMAAVLVALGTDGLSPAGWALGTVGGTLAFAAVLLLTGEVSPAQVRAVSAAARSRLGGGRAAA